MFCQNCGTELADDAVFCSKCGQQIKVQSENIEIVEPESRIKFFARLGLSTIVGVLGVVLSLIFFNETIGALVLSVLTALLITIVVMALMQKSNLRILVAIIVFVVVTFLYMDASMNILYLGGETFVQKIALFVYLCGPFTMWAMFITDKRRGPSFLVSTIKQLVIWVVLLMVLFILSNIKMNNYEERKEVAEIESEEVIEELNDDNVQEKENSEEYLEDNSLEQSVQSIYYSMTELQNGGQDVLFDNASLWAIANNWEELKSTPIAGQPVDCITYEDRIEFVYGNGLTLIWHYNEDTIDVVDTNASVDNSVVDENAEVSDDGPVSRFSTK